LEPRIRSWQPRDFDALHALDCACFPPHIAYSRRTLRSFLRLHGAQCLVSEGDGGAIAGFILTHSAGREGHIISLDVAEEFRRRGVGSALVAAAEETMAASGVHNVELETAVDNAPAIAFWRHHGYNTVGVLKDYYADRLDALAMTRDLRQSQERQPTCTSTRPLSSPSSRA
jgi:[ribosomal protein S18]-alanine N-acetyltransferase